MKNLARQAFFGSNRNLSAILAVGTLIFIGLGCFGSGRSNNSAPIPPAYFGTWIGQDGSTLTIRNDGKGDYKSGGTSVDGGTVEINDAKKELSITFFGIGPTFKVDSPPDGDEMKLSGMVYRRSGGSSASAVTDKTTVRETPVKASNSKDLTSKTNGEVPPDSEVESLIKDTLNDFTRGVEEEDFSTLHENASKDFQASYTPSQVTASFQSFITQKDRVLPVLNSVGETSAEFSSPPRIRTEKGYKILVAEGEFPTRPNATKFETEYEWEKGEWKMLKIKVML